VADVISSLEAMIQLGRRPGLRARVHDRLLSVLEAALQIRSLPGGHVTRGAPLVMRVDEFEVTYSLDLESRTIHLLAVDSAEDGRPQPTVFPASGS